MGLGTGYLIYGPQELFHFPKRDERVDFATGMWGIWMPGFMQFITGVYLFLGLTLFGTFKAAPLYMAALAFTAYGVHWFAIGWNRLRRADPRVNVGMAVSFLAISVLGIIVFFKADDNPVGGLFIGLACIYFSDIFASMGSGIGERALGFFHIGTGLWLFYLMYADILDAVLGYKLWI
jgi:cation transport ATPase